MMRSNSYAVEKLGENWAELVYGIRYVPAGAVGDTYGR